MCVGYCVLGSVFGRVCVGESVLGSVGNVCWVLRVG